MVKRDRDTVLASLAWIREGVERSCERSGRDPADVSIVAAGKTVELEVLRWVRDAGVGDFGENYVQELREKHDAMPDVTWHFIGTLQSHTAHHVAELAAVVETVVPGKAVERLARRAAEAGRTLKALIEVDFTGERTGVPPEQVADFADEVAAAEGVELAGLMTLPPIPEMPDDARPYFRRLSALRVEVAERHPGARELSMGMSVDFQVAVEEGATMVRIGTALFGERPPAG
jgi:pyridoxal phosphate enzyme (YggS family)